MLNALNEMSAAGAKRMLTNRCIPVSIYEYTP
jgi:hypothetical protein